MFCIVKNFKNSPNSCNAFQQAVEINSDLVKMLYVLSNFFFFLRSFNNTWRGADLDWLNVFKFLLWRNGFEVLGITIKMNLTVQLSL